MSLRNCLIGLALVWVAGGAPAAAAKSLAKQWKAAERLLARARRAPARMAFGEIAREGRGTSWEPRALHMLASLDYEEGRFAVAIEKWQAVARMSAVDGPTLFKARYNEALCEYRAGSPEDAWETLSAIPEAALDAQDEGVKRAYYELGVLVTTAADLPDDRAAVEERALTSLRGGDREYFKNTLDRPRAVAAVEQRAPAAVETSVPAQTATVAAERSSVWHASPRLGVGYFNYSQSNSATVSGAAGVVAAEIKAKFAGRWSVMGDGLVQLGNTPIHYVELGGFLGYELGTISSVRLTASIGLGYETLLDANSARLGFIDAYGARLRVDGTTGPWNGVVEYGPLSSDTSSLSFANYRLRVGACRTWPWGGVAFGAGADLVRLGLRAADAHATATLAQLTASVIW